MTEKKDVTWDTGDLSRTILRLEEIQIKLEAQRRDHNGQVLVRNDIEQLQKSIEIIKNLIIDNKYIWQRKE